MPTDSNYNNDTVNPDATEHPSFYRRACKTYAKRAFGMNPGICMKTAGLYTAVLLTLTLLQMNFGHQIYYHILGADTTAAQSGITFADGSLTAVLRLDTVGAVLASKVASQDLMACGLELLLIFLALVPLFYGTMNAMAELLRGRKFEWREYFRWYTDLGRLGKALCAELPIRLLRDLAYFVSAVPSVLIIAWANSASTGLSQGAATGMNYLSLLVMLAVLAVAYVPTCFLMPVRYVLAAEPELSVREAYRKGFQVLKGRRGQYYIFCLTFAVWQGLNMLCYGALYLYLLPYMTMSTMVFLHIIPARGENAGDLRV